MPIPTVIHPECVRFEDLTAEAWKCAASNVIEDPAGAAGRYMKEGFDQKYIYFWDTCFMTQYAKYAPDILPGIGSLDNFYAVQRKDGYIPRCYNLAGQVEPEYAGRYGNCNPPLAAWCEYDYVRQTGEMERVGKALPHLIALDQWLESTQCRSDGSWWFSDGAASGMDNSPRTARRNKFGNDVGWIDLAAQQALAAESIARLARLANDAPAEQEYLEKYEKRIAFLNHRHWCEKTGFYLDLLLQGLETENYRAYFSAAKTVASFWPLLAGACDPDKLKRMIGHLLDPKEFNRPHPVPSVSFDNPNYSDDGMYWQGAVWAPTNYMIVRGLLRYGEFSVARDIALRHIKAMNEIYRNFEPHTIWEAYSAEKAFPACNDYMEYGRESERVWVRDRFCGWSALGPTAMMIEAVLGIETDYLNRTVIWHSDCLEKHGIHNLRFGPYSISLFAEARRSRSEIPVIKVESPVKVDVRFQTL